MNKWSYIKLFAAENALQREKEHLLLQMLFLNLC